MPRLNRKRPSSTYTEEQRAMDLVLERKRSTRFNFNRYGTAMRFRQTCYEFRKAVERELLEVVARKQKEQNAALFGDGMPVAESDPSTWQIENEYEALSITVGQADVAKGAKPDVEAPGYMVIHYGGSGTASRIQSVEDGTTGEKLEL